jgi:HD superfamily phosphodiesterase
MPIPSVQMDKISLFVRSYLMRTAQTFGHENGKYRAAARWMHTLNVLKNIELILDGEKVDEETRDVCRIAAIFHDVDHYTVALEYHGQRGAETTSKYLTKEGYAPAFVERVAAAVRGHYYDMDDETPIAEQLQQMIKSVSFDARIVMDAETLDKIGVSNILQSTLTLCNNSHGSYEIARELTSGWPLQRAYLWKEILSTETGKRIGEERYGFYERFLAQIREELVLIDPYPSITTTQEIAQVSGI